MSSIGEDELKYVHLVHVNIKTTFVHFVDYHFAKESCYF